MKTIPPGLDDIMAAIEERDRGRKTMPCPECGSQHMQTYFSGYRGIGGPYLLCPDCGWDEQPAQRALDGERVA